MCEKTEDEWLTWFEYRGTNLEGSGQKYKTIEEALSDRENALSSKFPNLMFWDGSKFWSIIPEGVLIYEGKEDYILSLSEPFVWIAVDNLVAKITRTDEGVVCDIFANGQEADGSIASCYAFFNEVETEDEDPDYLEND